MKKIYVSFQRLLKTELSVCFNIRSQNISNNLFVVLIKGLKRRFQAEIKVHDSYNSTSAYRLVLSLFSLYFCEETLTLVYVESVYVKYFVHKPSGLLSSPCL